MDPIYLIATLASQFRFLFQVRTLMNEGMSKQGIQSRLQAHPYRVQMSMRQCQPYSSAFLLEQLRQLADLDQRIKSGRIDKKLGFELYLLQGSEMKQRSSFRRGTDERFVSRSHIKKKPESGQLMQCCLQPCSDVLSDGLHSSCDADL